MNKRLGFRPFLMLVLLFSNVMIACRDRNFSPLNSRPQQSVALKPKTKSQAAIAQDSESTKLVQLEYGDIWQQSKSESVIIPVGYKARSKKRRLDYSISKSSILRGQNLSAVNLIFHSHQNSSTHLLLERNAFITEFNYLVDTQAVANEIKPNITQSSCKPPAKTAVNTAFDRLMIYKIVDRDINQNQALDLEDANKGYLSDLTGKNLRSLTPDLTQLTQWHCDYQRNRLLLFVRELNLESQKNEIKPLALYLYDLPTSQLTRITPSNSSLENWKINLKDGLMYLYSRLDENGDRQYDSTDETRVTKYNLDTNQTTEINNPQIRESLSK